jgi:F-type H+-transporting ATPase subunit b
MKKLLLALALLALIVSATGYAAAQEHSAPAARPEHTSSAAPAENAGHATAAPAEASHESAGKEEEDENAAFKESASVKLLARVTGLSLHGAYWLAVILNFVIVAGVIIWFMRSSLPRFFRRRSATIQQQIEEARRAGADAQRRLSEVQERLSRLDQEIAALHADAEKDGRAEEERLRAAAEEDRTKIVASTKSEIEAARRLALTSLKAHAAELAVGLAAQRLTVDPDTDRRLVRTFAEDLGEEGK